MPIPLMEREKTVETFGTHLTLTTHRVLGEVSQQDNAAILIEDVIFCGVSRKSPPGAVVVIACALLLLGVLSIIGVGLGGFEIPKGQLLLLIGLLMSVWCYFNRSTRIIVSSANGSLSETIKGPDAVEQAENFATLIQTAKLDCITKRLSVIAST